MKWRILLDLPSFSMSKQSKIIMACMALHNFIRQSGMMDDLFDLCDQDENYDPNGEASSSQANNPNRRGTKVVITICTLFESAKLLLLLPDSRAARPAASRGAQRGKLPSTRGQQRVQCAKSPRGRS